MLLKKIQWFDLNFEFSAMFEQNDWEKNVKMKDLPYFSAKFEGGTEC